jgi:TRAP-type C4-dicarboxylate transport system permease small subunit
LSRILLAVSLIPRIALLILMITLLVDMMLGVFFRYVVGQALSWSEEVGTLSLVWLTFIGGAIGVHRGSHFAIHLLLDHLGPTGQRIANAAVALLILLLGALLVPTGLRLVATNATSETPALGLNLGVLYASAVVGGALMVCYAAAQLLDVLRGRPEAVGGVPE